MAVKKYINISSKTAIKSEFLKITFCFPKPFKIPYVGIAIKDKNEDRDANLI